MVRLSKRIAPAFLILGIAVSIGASWHIYRLESAEISSQFQREVDQASTNIEQVLVQYFEVVHGIANTLVFFHRPDPERFAELSQNVRRRHPAISSLSWYWQTEADQLAALEAAMAGYYGTFKLRSFADPAGPAAAMQPPRDDYLLLIAVDPAAGERQQLGLDLYSRARTGAAIREAIALDRMYISGAFWHNSQLSFAAFSPVFHHQDKPGQSRFAGLAGATFSVEPLLRHELQGHLSDWAVSLKAPQNRQADPEIFHATPPARLAPGQYRYQRTIHVGTWRDWTITAHATARYVAQRRSRMPQTVLLGGLLLTLLIYYIWMSQLSRTRNIEELVAERTQALSAANQRLRQLSQTDALTGIGNRRLFEERLHIEWLRLRRSKGYLALMMIDVDYFKAYNDHYGHQEGDRCLVRLAQCLADTVQRPADLVARYGGEEFIVLLPDTDDKALQLAREILLAVRALNIPHVRSRASKRITVSIGFGFAQAEQLESPQQLIIAADKAMYHAKASGRNRVAYAVAPSLAEPRLFTTGQEAG